MSDAPSRISSLGKYGVARNFSWIFIVIILLFGSAGTLYWLRGWIYVGYSVSYQVFYLILLLTINPQLLNDRGKYNLKKSKSYDKYFLASYFVLGSATFIVAGLDVRFQWSSIPAIVIYPSIVLLILTTILALWAHVCNTHFTLTSRNDKLGDQPVCRTGPYRYIRHPGYFAAIFQWISYPLILGSWLSCIPAFIYVSCIFARTYLEDKMLRRELKGYSEYSTATKYRLFPYIW